MTIPPENLPICLRNYEISFNSSAIKNGWYITTLYPTNKDRYRTWSINYAGTISNFCGHSFIMKYVFTGTTTYIINWEKFPITGTLTIGNQVYILNSCQIKVTGTNYVQNKSIDIEFSFTRYKAIKNEKIISINMFIYDNPGMEVVST